MTTKGNTLVDRVRAGAVKVEAGIDQIEGSQTKYDSTREGQLGRGQAGMELGGK